MTKGGSLPEHRDQSARGAARRDRQDANSDAPRSRLATGGDRTESGSSSCDDVVRHFLKEALTQRVAEEQQLCEPPARQGESRSAAGIGNGEVAGDLLAKCSRGVPPWKRVFDIAAIGAALPVWLPVMLIVMLAVRLSSKGPIFFKQRRVGYAGRSFMIYKFRSMRVNAETLSHESYFERLMRQGVPMAKLDAAGDPRIIPWGRFLRAVGLDELPQIFNVLRGEMSLVGPRPCTAQEFEYFTPHERQRVQVLPGLTGYWQVNGKNKTTFEEMIRMDLHYVENMSLRLDLAIIRRTIPTLAAQALELRKRPSVPRVPRRWRQRSAEQESYPI